MANNYTWKIANLEHQISDGFVFTAHYTVSAESDQLKPDGTAYTSGAYGSVGFQRPDSLVPYTNLTEAEVIGWVQDALGGAEKVAEIQAALDAIIAQEITPTTEGGVPWQ